MLSTKLSAILMKKKSKGKKFPMSLMKMSLTLVTSLLKHFFEKKKLNYAHNE